MSTRQGVAVLHVVVGDTRMAEPVNESNVCQFIRDFSQFERLSTATWFAVPNSDVRAEIASAIKESE